jgi:hypothetical protein
MYFVCFIPIMYNLKMWIDTVLVFVNPQTVSYTLCGHAYGLLYIDTVAQCLSSLFKLTVTTVDKPRCILRFSTVDLLSYPQFHVIRTFRINQSHCCSHLTSSHICLAFYCYCRLQSRASNISLQTSEAAWIFARVRKSLWRYYKTLSLRYLAFRTLAPLFNDEMPAELAPLKSPEAECH